MGANSNSRTINSIKNFSFGSLYQIITILINFILRTIFIHYLPVSYLGINGLFTNILSVLSLADLGLSAAMIFSLYNPIANNDQTLITALIHFYKKVYYIIALVVSIIGFGLIPFLKYIVNTDQPIPHLNFYYVLLLSNTIVSYFCIDKTSMFQADQKNHIIHQIYTLFVLIRFVGQVIALVTTRNYGLFLIIQVVSTISANLILTRMAIKRYPYLKNKQQLEKSHKKNVFENVKSLFIYKISNTLLVYTDNIIISVVIGTIWVGYYSNYLMIINGINAVLYIIFNSFKSSLANLINKVEDSTYNVFKELNFLSMILYGVGSTMFMLLISDFISLWAGESFVIQNHFNIVISINFFVIGMQQVITLYRDTTGLFKETKYVYLFAAILNIILSLIFGYYIGIVGVIGSTIVSQVVTSLWFEPFIIFKKYFNKKFRDYICLQSRYILVYILNSVIVLFVANKIISEMNWFMFGLKMLLGLFISFMIYGLAFIKTNEFKKLFKRVKSLVSNE